MTHTSDAWIKTVTGEVMYRPDVGLGTDAGFRRMNCMKYQAPGTEAEAEVRTRVPEVCVQFPETPKVPLPEILMIESRVWVPVSP